MVCVITYQSRAELGLWTNLEDTIQDPADSIGAPKKYFFKTFQGLKFKQKDFFTDNKNLNQYQAQFF